MTEEIKSAREELFSALSKVLPESEETEITSTWEKLTKIDVNEHIKKKGTLTYLRWAWAWGKLKDACPTASFEKHFFDGLPYAIDPQGFAYVQVSVTVENQTVTEVYAIPDHKNSSIKNPNSFEVNTALQRCLTKAIAYHGLGHYIYAGEDLPEDAEPTKPQSNNKKPSITPEQKDIIVGLIKAANVDTATFCKHYGIKSVDNIPAEKFAQVKKTLDGKVEAFNKKKILMVRANG